MRSLVTYRGRSIGIVALTVLQFLVGAVHVFFGLWILAAGSQATFVVSGQSPEVYSVYTLAFGLLVLIFTSGVWLGKRWGWVGTVAVSVFVAAADALTLLSLPSIPGIPRSAAAPEIIYSFSVLLYLSQTHVRIKYKTKF